MGLEEAAMNQAPVGLENGADRAATSRENPVPSTAPNQYNPNQIFQIGNGFGFFLIFLSQRYNPLDLASKVSVPRGCGPFGNPRISLRLAFPLIRKVALSDTLN